MRSRSPCLTVENIAGWKEESAKGKHRAFPPDSPFSLSPLSPLSCRPPKRTGALARFLAEQRQNAPAPSSPKVEFAAPASRAMARVASCTPKRVSFGGDKAPSRTPGRVRQISRSIATPHRPMSAVDAATPTLVPVRASKRDREDMGTDFYLTPVRRSARKVGGEFITAGRQSNR